MAQTKLQQKLDGAIKRMSHRKPWDHLDKNIPYDPNMYACGFHCILCKKRAGQGRTPNQHLKTLPFFAPNPASGISWNERQMPLKIFRRLILCVTITVSAVVIFAGSSS